MLTWHIAFLSQVSSGKVDAQDVLDILYLVHVAWLLYKAGESIGRGSFYGYRFDGAEHRAEAGRAEEFKKKEAEESAKVWPSPPHTHTHTHFRHHNRNNNKKRQAFAKIEKEIQEWIAKMEAENK